MYILKGATQIQLNAKHDYLKFNSNESLNALKCVSPMKSFKQKLCKSN